MDAEFRAITPQQINELGTYEIEEHRYLSDIGSDSYVLRHRKTGARVAILPNEDSNKVFYIGFRTPPADSTGVAHIIEHTVLCGSRDFPVKDPFIEVVKGSLNTFLNAMTYPDKTVYPVASTNEKDFDNLMHVYLDAVFHPNIYREENIFRQEGWHLEPVPDKDGHYDADSEITVNGVVYNEMKGVMSSPEDVLSDKVLASLYPHTTYAIVSGGDPKHIPELTYAQYLDFHRRYYHPSNSYIYLYGDMDMKERLRYLDEAYLSQYEQLDVSSAVVPEPPFTSPVRAEYPYSILPDEDTAGKTYLSLNFSLPTKTSAKDNLGMKILDYVLCDSEGAPLKEALRKRGIGQDVTSLYDAGILQPYYSICAQYAEKEQQEEFEKTVFDTFRELADQGIDRKALAAGISNYEFHYREADFGAYPKGLIYGLDALDTWLYDDRKVFDGLTIGPLFDELRKDAERGWFEGLIRRCFLDNPHRSSVILQPVPGLTEQNEQREKEKMKALHDKMSAQERQNLLLKYEALRRYQETPSTKEELATIPVLERTDLGRKTKPLVNRLLTQEPAPVLAHDIFTSGIDYATAVFDITDLPDRLLRYAGIFKTLLSALDTQNYSYSALDNEIHIVSGGFSFAVSAYSSYHENGRYKLIFEAGMKSMHRNFKESLELLGEVLLRTKFDDKDRIRTVLEEELAGMKSSLPSAGHSTAVQRASAYLRDVYAKLDSVNNIGEYDTLKEILEHFDEQFDCLRNALEELRSCICSRARLLFDIIDEKSLILEDLPAIREFALSLSSKETSFAPGDTGKNLSGTTETFANEGLTTAGQVQFVCAAGDYYKKGLPYTGALSVLRVILGYDYLWNNIRVKGGAYGCMSGFSRNGIGYLVSYRDPHLSGTFDVYKKAGDAIRHFEADERTLTKYVIGAISSLDRPLTPSAEGGFSMNCWLSGITDEDLQKERTQVLDVSLQDIRRLGDYLDAIISQNCICVVGSESKIRGRKDLFGSIRPLL